MMYKKKAYKIISMILILTTVFSIFAPSISTALEVSREEHRVQAAWNDILDVDLSSEKSIEIPSNLNPDVSKEIGVKNNYEEEYKTDRFIIKYKNEAAKTQAQTRLSSMNFTIQTTNEISSDSQAIQSNNDEIFSLNKNVSLKTKESLRTDTDVLVMNYFISTAEMKSNIAEQGISQYIEYIQPDYEMMVSEANADDLLSTISEYEDTTYTNQEGETAEFNDVGDSADEIENPSDEIGVVENIGIDTDIRNTKNSVFATGITVALLDTGIDTTHPDLSGHLYSGWDFVNNDDTVNDAEWYYEQGHGTMIAGIIKDMTPDAKILPIKIFQGGIAYTSDIIAAIEYAEQMGTQIANCSWGSRYENRALREAMEKSAILFVCATGNNLYNTDKYPVYPASFNLANIISVASVGEDDKLSRFSNYGVETVDVAALGVDIQTTWLNGEYNSGNGTSMSAGFVSGLAAALMLKYESQNIFCDARNIKARVIDSADTITGLQDKIHNGKRINKEYALSDNILPNPFIINVPDDEELLDIIPYGDINEEYEEYGAQYNVDIKAPLPTPRQSLCVVALGDKIYAVGGSTSSTITEASITNKVEVYNPATNTWETKANMTYARIRFGAVVYKDKIYILGGDGISANSYKTNVECYDPITNTWSVKSASPSPVRNFTPILDEKTGKVYIISSDGSDKAYVYNILTDTWTVIPSLSKTRMNYIAYCSNGYIFITGGTDRNGINYLDSSETYNISNDSVPLYSIKPTGSSFYRNINARSLVLNNSLIVIGGESGGSYSNSVSYFKTNDTPVFTNCYYTNRINVSRSGFGTASINGKVYVIGGKRNDGLISIVEEIDLGWKEKASLPVPMKKFSKVENNGNLFVMGGSELVNGVEQPSKSIYEYSPVNNKWSKKADLPFYIDKASLISQYGKIYLIGGYKKTSLSGDFSYITNVYEYDPYLDTWTEKSLLPTPKDSFAFTIYNDRIYTAGGRNKSGSLDKVEIYDTFSDTWTIKNPLPKSMDSASAYIINNKIYMYEKSDLKTIYLYNDILDLWEKKPTIGDRKGSLFFGIYNNLYGISTEDVSVFPYLYKYSPEDNMWIKMIMFNYCGIIQEAERISNSLYVFLGDDFSSKFAEYTLPLNPWISKSNAPETLESCGYAVLNNKIYIAGNSKYKDNLYDNTLYEYDPVSDKWTKKANMQYGRFGLTLVAAANKLYAIGGSIYYNNGVYGTSVAVVNYVEEYNPETNTWKTKNPFPTSYKGCTYMAGASVNDKIYLFGGSADPLINSSAYPTLSTVYEYDPSTDIWKSKLNMPTARCGAGAAVIDGKIYVVGGMTKVNINVYTNVVEVYNPATNTWETKAGLPYACAFSGITAKDTLYVVGGSSGQNKISNVFEYSPLLDKWFTWAGPNLSTSNNAAAITNDGLYSIGGLNTTNAAISNCEFTPISGLYNEYLHMGSDEINISGNFSETYTDMEISTPGFVLNIARTYNSKDNRDSTKGNIISKGWTFGLQGKLDNSGNDIIIRLPNGAGHVFNQKADGTYYAKDTRGTLIRQADGSHIFTTKDQYTYCFDTKGYLIWMKDRNGNAVNMTVDSSGKITSVQDQAGRTYTITYISNRISTIKDNIGRIVTYAYDSNNRLSSVSDPMGNKTYYYYDTAGYLSSIKDHNGNVIKSVEYYPIEEGETLPKVKKVTDKNGNAETYNYTNSEGKMETTDSAGKKSIVWYDKSLYPIRSIDVEGRETKTIYHQDGGVNRYGEIYMQLDRNGNSTYFDRDKNGNTARVLNHDGSTVEYEYDNKNNLLCEKDEEGKMTYYVYDSEKINLLKKIKPLDGTTAYSENLNQSLFLIESTSYYTAAEALAMCGRYIYGLVKTKTDPEGGTTTYKYDSMGYVSEVTDSLNNTTKSTYNSIGLLVKETTAKGYNTQYYYDKNGFLLKKVLHSGETERYVYNVLGMLTQQVQPNQYNAANDTATFTADNIISNTGVYNGTAQGYRYVYNTLRQLTSKTDPMNNTTSYTYDMYDNVLTETLPNGGVNVYSYDVMNRLKTASFKETSSSMSVPLEEYTYIINTDGTIKNIKKNYLNDTETATVSQTYDYAGRLLRADNADGTYTRNEYYKNGLLKISYDARNNATYYKYNYQNLLSEQWSAAKMVGSTIMYEYQALEYDKCGRIVLQKGGKNVVPLYSVPSDIIWNETAYNRNGTISEITDSAGRKIVYAYDADKNVIKEETYASEKEKNIIEYSYNHLWKVVERKVHAEKSDIYGQSGAGTIYLTISYTYDKNGNLITTTDPSGIITTNTYDNLNRLVKTSQPGKDESNNSVNIEAEMTYNEMDIIATTKDANGNITTFTYDKRGNLTQKTDAKSNVEYYTYDRIGRKTAEVSPANYRAGNDITQMNRTEYTYDITGKLLKKTEKYIEPDTSVWKTIIVAAFEYDANGNIVKSFDALGWLNGYYTSISYDLMNRQTLVTDPEGGTVSAEYDGLGRKVKETDPKGYDIVYNYDDAGNITQSVSGDVKMSKTYDKTGNVLTHTDGNGNVTTYTYNSFGKLRTVVMSGDLTISADTVIYKYTINSNLASEINSESREILYTYDNQGRLLTKTDRKADGTQSITTSCKYDTNGNLRYETDTNGNVTSYVYDALNRVVSSSITVSGQLKTVSKNYDANGNILSETDWLGNVNTYEYDSLNRVIKTRDATNTIIERVEYNVNGAQIKSTDAMGRVTRFEYDKLCRLTNTIDALNNTKKLVYDKSGNVVSETDSRSNTITKVYDRYNRLTAINDPSGAVIVSYTYDKNGNMLTQTNGTNNVTSNSYNVRNLLITRTVTGGAPEKYTYNADGSVKTFTDRMNRIFTYSYDIHGRLLSKVNGTNGISYTYDNNGNQITMTESTGTTTRTYDSQNRVLTKTAPNVGTMTFTYDITAGLAAGYRSEKTTDSKGNIVTKTYDKAGRLANVQQSAGTTTYTYNANGTLQKITYPGGAYEEYTYYDDNRLHTLTNRKSNGNIIDAYNYGYDANGNISQKLDGTGTTAYTYDNMNRLLTVTEPGGKITSYTYDSEGNRKTEMVTSSGSTTTTTYSYDTQNRMISKVTGGTTVSYTYDANGNQLTEKTGSTVTVTNTYDIWNNLVKTVTGSATVENIYNGDGLRVKKTSGSDVSQYVYEYDKVILELDGNGNIKAANVYGLKLISRIEGGAASFYMYNGHGDVTAVMSGGEVVASYYYDAFGVHLSSTGTSSNPYRYSGYMYDSETGLYYLNSRFYNAETARFLQEDSYRGNPNDPLSLNLYAYVKYNPLIYFDPDGHAEVKINGKTVKNLTYASEIDKTIGDFYEIFKALGGKRSVNKKYQAAVYKLNGVKYVYALDYDPMTVRKTTSVEEVLGMFNYSYKFDKIVTKNYTNASNPFNDYSVSYKKNKAKPTNDVSWQTKGKEFLYGFGGAVADNIQSGFWNWAVKTITGRSIASVPKPWNLKSPESYYLGRVAGDTLSIAIGAGETVAGVLGFISSLAAGGATTLMSGGILTIAGVQISIAGVAVSTAVAANGATIVGSSIAALQRDWDNFQYAKSNGGMGIHSSSLSWKGFSKGKLTEHYQKHVVEGKEFGNISQNEYLNQAKSFATELNSSFKETQVGNFIVKYDPVTKRTLIANIKDREIRTFYIAYETNSDPFQSAINLAKQISGTK